MPDRPSGRCVAHTAPAPAAVHVSPMFRPELTAPGTRPVVGETFAMAPSSFGVVEESHRKFAPYVSQSAWALPPVKPLTFSVAWIDRLDGLRFWIDAWLGVTIQSALAAAVNAAGIGQVLIVTLPLSGSISASFCHVFTPAAQTYPEPMPSVFAPFCAPEP